MSKNILLIGGSYGIGKALAETLSKNNQVIVASRTFDGFDSENINDFNTKTETFDNNEEF